MSAAVQDTSEDHMSARRSMMEVGRLSSFAPSVTDADVLRPRRGKADIGIEAYVPV